MTGAPLAAPVVAGGQVNPALGLGGPQTLALRRQDPWDGPLLGRPMVRVYPQEAGRPDPLAVRPAEGRAEVRVLAIGSMGPSVLARGALKARRGLGVPCPFSRAE